MPGYTKTSDTKQTGPRCLYPSPVFFRRTDWPKTSDHESLTLHQVKAYNIRAFAGSKAFPSGVSLEQLLSACHWKSHNTIPQFYLKDVAWDGSELFHLGTVVVAQQIHH